MQLDIRILSHPDQMNEVFQLMEVIWGKGTAVNPSLLIAHSQVGAIVLGAYDKDLLVGFSYGFPALEGLDNSYFYSHALGVHSKYRGLSIGHRLKTAQAIEAQKRGHSSIKWTFDPLQCKNAFLNIHKLGAVSNVYKRNFYGDMKDLLNYGLESDRLVVEWNLNHDKIIQDSIRLQNCKEVASLAHNPFQTPKIHEWYKLDTPYLSVPLPTNIEMYKKESLDVVKLWRLDLRNIFQYYFTEGYIIAGFDYQKEREIQYYLLKKKGVLTIDRAN
jgi:predicted GNAT superfamily acetyltransferase